jgi:cell division GTPase FtsZ
MTTQITNIQIDRENIVDDITETNKQAEKSVPVEMNVDEDKLAKLREKLKIKQKETEMTANHNNVAKRDKSIKFGVVGSGQAGSRIAETFYKLGYDAVCINLAQQDLKFISIPESNKLHLNWGLGGAAKDLSIGKAAAEQYKPQIAGLVNAQLADAQVLILALSLGGGSGAGSCETLVDVLTATGKPVCVITALPMDSDGQQTKAMHYKH